MADEVSRRAFLQGGLLAGTAFAIPTIVPASVLGATAPSNKINIGVIGCGRIAHAYNVPACLEKGGNKLCSFIATCDVDLVRARHMRRFLMDKRRQGRDLVGDARCVQDYHQVLANKDIDAVLIATPDHWHAPLAIEAMIAGKDVFLQKPMAMSIGEGRAIIRAARKFKRVIRTGTQQRTEENFLHAVECVFDGRIGKVLRAEIGLPEDPQEYNLPVEEPLPKEFDWNMWLGSTPEAPYSRLRSHKRGVGARAERVDFDRPGWLTIQQYCMGMITGWGAHHLDIGQWGLAGYGAAPTTIVGTAEYPKGRKLWDVHGDCDITFTYPNGGVMKVGKTRDYPCGIRFIGASGDWIFCSRGNARTTASDPGGKGKPMKLIEASKPELIAGAVKNPLPRTKSHHHEWLHAMRSRKEMGYPVEEVQCSSNVCILGYTAMKLGRKLTWDGKAERFVNDEAANRTLFREERDGFGVKRLLKDLA